MFHLDLKLLRSFVAVATEASVTRAAARLNLSQPSVSGQIKQLEDEIGFALFHRSTRRVILTHKGAQILPLVTSIIDQCMTLKRDVEEIQTAKADHFTLGAAMFSMDFPTRVAFLDSFAARYPHMSYTISNPFQCMQVRDLVLGRLDAALLLGIPAPMRMGDKSHNPAGAKLIANECVFPDHLERVVLRKKPIGLILPADHPLALHPVIPQAALRDAQITMLSPEHGAALLDPLTAYLHGAGCTLISPPEGNALAIERYAERTGGIAIGIGWFPLRPGMVWRAVEDLDLPMEYAMLLAPSANKAARRLFAFAKEWAKSNADPAIAAAAPRIYQGIR